MALYEGLFKPAHLQLDELIEKAQEYDNSNMFVDYCDTLISIEIPPNAPEDKKLILLNTIDVLKAFYIKDNISYYRTSLNKVYFTESLKQERLREFVSKDFLSAIELSDDQLPFFPLWFTFAYPNIVKWFYEDFKGKKIICNMFSESIARIQMPISEMTRMMIDRSLHDTFDYFLPEYSFNNIELRRLISIYYSSQSETTDKDNNEIDFGKFRLLSNISDANKLTYESILLKYYNDYKIELGERKYIEISNKINESNSAKKLIDESNRDRIKVTMIDFTTYIPKMVLMFGKPETIALASLKILERWNKEVNRSGGLGNGEDIKVAVLRILSSCERMKFK